MSKYNPLVFSATENAAFNAAHATWTVAEIATHYVLLPMIPIVLKVMYEGSKHILGYRAPAPAPVPAQNQGFFSWAWNKTKSAASTVGKYFVLPEVASSAVHKLWAKPIWDGFRLYATSFMRPFYEKLLPGIFEYWDKNDLNFSLRDMAPDSILSPFFYGGRNIINFFTSTTAQLDEQVFAKNYYERGQKFTEYFAQYIDFTARGLKGVYESGRCLESAEAAKQCATEAYHFMGEVAQLIPGVSTIKTTVGGSFASWGNTLKEGIAYYPVEALKLGDAALWGIAEGVHAQLPVIPAHLVYYLELGAAGYLGYKFTMLAASLAIEKARQAVLGAGGINQINHNHIAVQRGGDATPVQQVPAVVQQGAPNAPGAIAPQQQLVFNQIVGGQAPAANLGLQADGANVVPAGQNPQQPVQGGVPAPVAQNMAPQAPVNAVPVDQNPPVAAPVANL